MTHPSLSDNEEPEPLPDGVSEEAVLGVLTRASTALARLGVYADEHLSVQVQEGRLIMIGHFAVGDLAFSKRVQNPEQDDFDESFRVMEREAVYDQAEDILDEFRRDDT